MKRVHRTKTLMAVIALFVVPSLAIGQQNDAQQSCINTVNKRGADVHKKLEKQFSRCLRRIGDERPPAGQTLAQCRNANSRTLQRGLDRTVSAEASRCGVPPDFGYTSAATVNTAFLDEGLGLKLDIFGSDVDAAIILRSSDVDGAKCQRAINRDSGKVVQRKLSEFLLCKKTGLGDGSITSAVGLEVCFDAINSDGRGRIGAAADKLTSHLASRCAGLDLNLVFPGDCVGAGDVAVCLERATECRACRALNAADGLARDCDVFDDGLANSSCTAPSIPSTTTSTTSSTTNTTSTTIPECGNGIIEGAEQCDGGECCTGGCVFQPLGVSCTDDGNECTDNQCDGAGVCEAVNNTAVCDDGVFCNGADTCLNGGCDDHAGDPCAAGGDCADTCDENSDSCDLVAGTPCTDDGNVCTNNQCDGAGSCVAINNTASCDDGFFCNGTDTCSGGSCGQHTGDPCTGGAECADSCDEGADNCFVATGTTCTADANVCSDNQCDGAGHCAGVPNADPCDDGVYCNGTDTCSAGTCGQHTGDPCSGGAECADTCNEAGNTCNVPSGTSCTDDGNGCTDNECNGSGSCLAVNNTAPCDDSIFCNGADTCSGGACGQHAGDPCSGGAECADSCNEAADNCYVASGTTCTDDGNVCTDNECDGSGSCAATNNTDSCSDGLFCTSGDVCVGGICSGQTQTCAGNGECADTCDEGGDTCNEPVGTPCTDDGNVCTDNECDGSGVCAANNNTAPCDDGDLCTENDTCSGGSCQTGSAKDCSSLDDDCNTGACDGGTGNCVANPVASGTPCTDDGNVCTDNECNGSGSCAANNNTDSCDDGLFCTITDVCSGGSCVGSGDPCAGNGELPVGDDSIVSTSPNHSCGVQSNSSVACWGQDTSGSTTPAAGTYTQVSVGEFHSCGIHTNTSAECWGGNTFGQGSVPGGEFFKQLSAGVQHSCGVRTNDTVTCWGNNGFNKATPPGGTFTQVSVGSNHSCGLHTDDTIECWGSDAEGQVTGNPGGTYTMVTTGALHTCGVHTDGTMACWGRNTDGQATAPGGTFRSVSGGSAHTCAVASDRSVSCWGKDAAGQASPPAGAFRQVSAGNIHSCGVRVDGTVECWGSSNGNRLAAPATFFGDLTLPECADTCDDVGDTCNLPAATACPSDGNQCTDNECDGSGVCVTTNNTDGCDDGLFCTTVSSCQVGVCVGQGDPCAGGASCQDVCDEGGDTCLVPSGTACADEGEVCTTDECDGAGTCQRIPNALSCNDSLFCNGTDTCALGTCSIHTGDPCVGGAECADTCDESRNSCRLPFGTVCTSDGNVCTDNVCSAVGTCIALNNADPCDDNLFCNGTDTCQLGGCDLHTGDPCSGNPDCQDICDDVGDTCLEALGTTCDDDGDVCTVDECDGAGTCDHTGTCQREIRVNVAGGAFVGTDYPGSWDADPGVCTGTTFSTVSGILGTVDDALFQDEYNGNPLACTIGGVGGIPVLASGTYRVNLLFGEIFWGPGCPGGSPSGGNPLGSGERVFDIQLEGSTVLSNFDIYSEGRCAAAITDPFAGPVAKSYDVSVTDGALNINMPASVGNAKISAIEVLLP